MEQKTKEKLKETTLKTLKAVTSIPAGISFGLVMAVLIVGILAYECFKEDQWFWEQIN